LREAVASRSASDWGPDMALVAGVQRRRVSDAGLAPRRIAKGILERVEVDRAFADVLLGHHIGALEPADRRLVTRLVLGTLTWQGRLDYELRHLSSRPLGEIDPSVLVILRMGLFQLRYTNRIPRHAAVATTVELAQESPRVRKASGFINAILRKAAAAGECPMPSREDDLPGYLAIAYSHPRWLAEKFIEWFGLPAAEQLMAANNEAAPNVVRLNLERGKRTALLADLYESGFASAGDSLLDETLVLAAVPPNLSRIEERRLGCMQSEVSQWIARMVAPPAGGKVVDCAAAPGGKATHLAELVGSRGRVIAVDFNHAGIKRARSLARRLGHSNIDFICADTGRSIPLKAAVYDAVLLDAPCTGLGTLRQHPKIRWRLRPSDLQRLAALQNRMLTQAATIVRPGGALVYSVCSLAPDEGRQVIDAFCERNPSFKLDSTPPVPDLLRRELQPDGTLLTRPDRGGRDGFFAARLIRCA
jgi:16S rRNA (cytosine967-C5)-methyltransferase